MSAYEVFADWYDLLTEDVDYGAVSRYLCGILAHYGVRDGLLLDLACGTGSLSVPLSRAGYEVIGVDGSADMLCIARQKALDAGIFSAEQPAKALLMLTVLSCLAEWGLQTNSSSFEHPLKAWSSVENTKSPELNLRKL